VIVEWLDSQLPVKSVPITTKIVLVAIKSKGPYQESKTWQRSAISKSDFVDISQRVRSKETTLHVTC
jgi:hypothetical protein